MLDNESILDPILESSPACAQNPHTVPLAVMEGPDSAIWPRAGQKKNGEMYYTLSPPAQELDLKLSLFLFLGLRKLLQTGARLG